MTSGVVIQNITRW